MLLAIFNGCYVERKTVQLTLGEVSQKYTDLVLARLKKRELIASVIKKKRAYYYLTKKGYEYIYKHYGLTEEDSALFSSTLAVTRSKSEEVLKRVARSSRSLITSEVAGIKKYDIENFGFPNMSEEKVVYLEGKQLKKILGEEIKTSMVAGMIMNKRCVYRIYSADKLFLHTSEDNELVSRFRNKYECKFKDGTKDIIFSSDISTLPKFISRELNNTYTPHDKNGLIIEDAPLRSTYKIPINSRTQYLITLDSTGIRQLKLLANDKLDDCDFYMSKLFDKEISNIQFTEARLTDEKYKDDNSLYYCINQIVLNLGVLKTILKEVEKKDSRKRFCVIVLKSQADFFKKFFNTPKVKVIPLKDEFIDKVILDKTEGMFE